MGFINSNNKTDKLNNRLHAERSKHEEAKRRSNNALEKQKRRDQKSWDSGVPISEKEAEALRNERTEADREIKAIEKNISELTKQITRLEFEEYKKNAPATTTRLEKASQTEQEGLDKLLVYKTEQLIPRREHLQKTLESLVFERNTEEHKHMKSIDPLSDELPAKPKKITELDKQIETIKVQLRAVDEAITQTDRDIAEAKKAVHDAKLALAKHEHFCVGIEYMELEYERKMIEDKMRDNLSRWSTAEQKTFARLVHLGIPQGMIKVVIPKHI